MNLAMRMLLNEKNPISQVAYSLGYDKVSGFLKSILEKCSAYYPVK